MIFYRFLMLMMAMSFIVAAYFVFRQYDVADPLYGILCLFGFILFGVGSIRREEGE